FIGTAPISTIPRASTRRRSRDASSDEAERESLSAQAAQESWITPRVAARRPAAAHLPFELLETRDAESAPAGHHPGILGLPFSLAVDVDAINLHEARGKPIARRWPDRPCQLIGQLCISPHSTCRRVEQVHRPGGLRELITPSESQAKARGIEP